MHRPLPPPPTQASTIGLSPSRMLDTAKSDYFSGSYASAVSGFDSLLRTFPTSEAAAEAQFMLGETYSQQKRYPEAVNAYTAAIQKFPRSMWVPEAYYKRGKAQESLGTARGRAGVVRAAAQDLSGYTERRTRQASARSSGASGRRAAPLALDR